MAGESFDRSSGGGESGGNGVSGMGNRKV
jgi:hypothetical protein